MPSPTSRDSPFFASTIAVKPLGSSALCMNKAAVTMAPGELITRRERRRVGEFTGKLEWNESLDGRNETQPRLTAGGAGRSVHNVQG